MVKNGSGGNGGGPNATDIPQRKMTGPVSERLNWLEKRYSKVLVHQTYFSLLDEWMHRMFGARIFPKAGDLSKLEDDDAMVENNPFYELHMLHRKVAALEEKIANMESSHVGSSPTKPGGRFKSVVPPPPQIKRPYQPTVRRKAGYHARLNSELQSSVVPNPLHKSATATSVIITSTPSKEKSADEAVAGVSEKDGVADADNATKTNTAIGKDGEATPDETDGELKPPVLKQEIGDSEGSDGGDKAEALPDDEDSATYSQEDMEMEDDDDDEDYEDESVDRKPTINQEGVVVEGIVGRRSGRGVKRSANAALEKDDDEPVVTYTTRGRRHTLPRRYAEFTGHDNVASILKSQQRAAASQGPKLKKQIPAVEKIKTPTKQKATPVAKPTPPKKPVADGTRPEIVYELITKVQNKEVDEEGNVVLWEEYPAVKVNQQQLISVIYRSNGMSTRLTRKLTTLVFEDQVLANASPFGTKYYSERLPPEPLLAMVEFISASGFDPDYTKKKIYMIVGQVCNEARAGRVRKLVPPPEIKAEEMPSSSSATVAATGAPSSSQ